MSGIVTESPVAPRVFAENRTPLEECNYPIKEVERTVPFVELLSGSPPAELHPEHVAAGLAAAFTSSVDNPFFKLPTGQDEQNGALPAAFAIYAPYYIGTGFTPEQIALDVAAQAAAYLHRLEAQHGYDGYVSRMMAVLRRGHVAKNGLQALEDRNILFDIHDFLAVTMNHLHHLVPLTLEGIEPSSPALEYRAETHEQVDPFVPTISYQAVHDTLKEQFDLPRYIRSHPGDLVALGWDFFDTQALRRGAEFAALAAEKVGSAVIRESLEQHYIPYHLRRIKYLQKAR